MGQPERDFLNYYRENMQKTPGITLLGEVPKTLWGNIGKAAASLTGVSEINRSAVSIRMNNSDLHRITP
jgi:hypothetical protein